MRWAIAALVILIAGAAAAQPARRYDLYILDTADGREIYAVAAAGRATAIEVRGCGDVSVIAEPTEIVSEMRTRRARDVDDVIVVGGRHSRIELGHCGVDETSPDYEDPADEPSTFLVVAEDMSPTQIRHALRSLDAAPVAIRERMMADLGL